MFFRRPQLWFASDGDNTGPVENLLCNPVILNRMAFGFATCEDLGHVHDGRDACFPRLLDKVCRGLMDSGLIGQSPLYLFCQFLGSISSTCLNDFGVQTNLVLPSISCLMANRTGGAGALETPVQGRFVNEE